MPAGRRVLFLDDDQARGEAFLAANPGSIWVQTAADCLAELAESWDEIHLDHDLGGEQFVDHARDDCGMAVVRWLCETPRPHLKDARFVVHTHNQDAACVMVFHLQVTGYRVTQCPFGTAPPLPGGCNVQVRQSWLGRVLSWVPGRR